MASRHSSICCLKNPFWPSSTISLKPRKGARWRGDRKRNTVSVSTRTCPRPDIIPDGHDTDVETEEHLFFLLSAPLLKNCPRPHRGRRFVGHYLEDRRGGGEAKSGAMSERYRRVDALPIQPTTEGSAKRCSFTG